MREHSENQNAGQNAATPKGDAGPGGSFENLFRNVREHAESRNAGRKPGGWALAISASGIGVAYCGSEREEAFFRLRVRWRGGCEAGEIADAETAAPYVGSQLLNHLLC